MIILRHGGGDIQMKQRVEDGKEVDNAGLTSQCGN